MLLHLLNQAPPAAAFHQCIAKQRAGDAIVLFQDGVYALLDDALPDISAKLYVVGEDALARGLALEELQATLSLEFTVIDYRDWVALSVDYPRSISWY